MNAVADIDSKFFNFLDQFFCFASLNFRAHFILVSVCPSTLGTFLIDLFLLVFFFFNFLLTWHVFEFQECLSNKRFDPKAFGLFKYIIDFQMLN